MRTIAVIMGVEYGYMRGTLKGIAAFVGSHPQWRLDVEPPMPAALEPIKSARPAGVITHGLTSPQLSELQKNRVKVLTLFESSPRDGVPDITVDDVECGRLMGQQLAKCGLRHFGFVSGGYELHEKRLRGFCASLGREPGDIVRYILSPDQVDSVHWRSLGWHKHLAEWLSKQPRPLALGCCDDVYAYGTLEACRLLDLKVPDDVAVIGMGNDDVLCHIGGTPLSSVAIPWDKIGFEAASLLAKLADGEEIPPQTLIAPSGVVPRTSSDITSTADDDVATASRYIRQHFHRASLTVDAVTRHVSMSRRSLERRFRKHLGWTIVQEIRRVRVERARQLLAETDIPIKVIAQQVGLGGIKRLNELFTSIAGTSPSKFRVKFRPELYT